MTRETSNPSTDGLTDVAGRRENRMVVDDLYVLIDGARYDILDIAFSSVRLAAQTPYDGASEASLIFMSERRMEPGVNAAGRLVRKDAVSVVFTYATGKPDWEEFLDSHNSFAGSRLDVNIWDD